MRHQIRDASDVHEALGVKVPAFSRSPMQVKVARFLALVVSWAVFVAPKNSWKTETVPPLLVCTCCRISICVCNAVVVVYMPPPPKRHARLDANTLPTSYLHASADTQEHCIRGGRQATDCLEAGPDGRHYLLDDYNLSLTLDATKHEVIERHNAR